MVLPEVLDAGVVTLRRWTVAWVDDLDRAIRASLPELSLFMPWATENHGVAESQEFIDRSRSEWDAGETWNYAMFDAAERVVGACGLMTRMGPGVLEIGYWVGSAYAGHGVATAAALSLADAALHVDGVERVVIKHDIANPASGRVAQKAGFSRVGQIETEPLTPAQTGVQAIWELRRAENRVSAAAP